MSRQIDLFIPSDKTIAQPLIAVIDKWSEQYKEDTFTIKRVLEYPLEIVQYQLFYTPALVVDGKMISMEIDSAEILQTLLVQHVGLG